MSENLRDKIEQEIKDIEASAMGLRQLFLDYEEATNSQIAELEDTIQKGGSDEQKQ